MKKNPYLTFPREFTTGKWRVHLVYPGEPGADDGGYSLSGEAKEAALLRFALPENRKAALDVIRKLNESRDSNDNAL